MIILENRFANQTKYLPIPASKTAKWVFFNISILPVTCFTSLLQYNEIRAHGESALRVNSQLAVD